MRLDKKLCFFTKYGYIRKLFIKIQTEKHKNYENQP